MISGIPGGIDPQSMLSKMREMEASRPGFADLDRDGNRSVSRAEFQDVFQSTNERLPIDADTMFAKIDTNQDQVLTADELNAMRDRAERMQQLMQQFASAGAAQTDDALGQLFASGGDDRSDRTGGQEEDEEFDPVRTLLDALRERDESEQSQNSAYAAATAAYRASSAS